MHNMTCLCTLQLSSMLDFIPLEQVGHDLLDYLSQFHLLTVVAIRGQTMWCTGNYLLQHSAIPHSITFAA